MVSQGIIASRTYSLYLNDLDVSTWTILFGGIDSEKFSGILQTLPINEKFGSISEFYISLTGISNARPGANCTATIGALSSYPLNVLLILDSGTAFITLPINLTNATAAEFRRHPRRFRILQPPQLWFAIR